MDTLSSFRKFAEVYKSIVLEDRATASTGYFGLPKTKDFNFNGQSLSLKVYFFLEEDHGEVEKRMLEHKEDGIIDIKLIVDISVLRLQAVQW